MQPACRCSEFPAQFASLQDDYQPIAPFWGTSEPKYLTVHRSPSCVALVHRSLESSGVSSTSCVYVCSIHPSVLTQQARAQEKALLATSFFCPEVSLLTLPVGEFSKDNLGINI